MNQLIRDLNDTPYPIDDFFQRAECDPEKSGGTKSPILHLTAEAPCTRVDYPEIIYHYYSVKRKHPELWLKVVNAKNSKGETFLDYLESLNIQKDFNTVDTKACANQLITFSCQTGGIYSIHKEKNCSVN